MGVGAERSVRGLGAGLFPGTLPGQYAQGFQAAYRIHAAVPKGSTTFAGKRIVTSQRLAPTPQNLAQLIGPNAPRDAR
jgi:hypothetical protein